MASEVTADLVRAAYLLFLGRQPENEGVVRHWLGVATVDELRKAFLAAPEFRGRFAAALPPAPPPAAPAAAAPAAAVAMDVPALHVEWQVEGAVAEALLAHVKRTWTRLGQEQPHWSVLSTDAFKPERIAANEAAFLASGERDVHGLTAILQRNGFAPKTFRRVFEFGCGVGRVTPHLARVFGAVVGCDVSESHLALAREAVARANLRNVTFSLAASADFGMDAAFDLWFSRIVLQHNSPPIIALILRRALSLLAPGGVAVLQVPTYAVGYAFRVESYLARLRDDAKIEMHVLPQPVIFEIAARAGCETVEVMEDRATGLPNWRSNTFVFHKRVKD